MGSGAVEIESAHLVERLGPSLSGRGSSNPQNPHGFDVSVPRLGLTGSVTRLRQFASGSNGVLGVGLALAPPALAVRTIDLDQPDPLALEVTGDIRPHTNPSLLPPDQLDGAEMAQPPQQFLVAGSQSWRSSRRRGALLVRPKPQLHGRRGVYRPRR